MIKYTDINEQSGFTLVEIVIAISVLAVMLTLSYSSINTLISSKEILEDQQTIDRIEQVLVRRICQELQLAYPNIPRLPPADDLDKRFHSYESFLGEPSSLPTGRPADSITFVAISAGQYFMEDRTANAGLVQISYRVLEDPELSEETGERSFSLIREEIPYKRPFEKAHQEAVRFPLVQGVDGLMFEYYDSNTEKWVTSWGDEQYRDLPAMVRFTLLLRTPKGKERVITGSAPLRAKRTQ